MDEVRSLLQSFAAATAMNAGLGIYTSLVAIIRKRGLEKRTQEIKKWLEAKKRELA